MKPKPRAANRSRWRQPAGAEHHSARSSRHGLLPLSLYLLGDNVSQSGLLGRALMSYRRRVTGLCRETPLIRATPLSRQLRPDLPHNCAPPVVRSLKVRCQLISAAGPWKHCRLVSKPPAGWWHTLQTEWLRSSELTSLIFPRGSGDGRPSSRRGQTRAANDYLFGEDARKWVSPAPLEIMIPATCAAWWVTVAESREGEFEFGWVWRDGDRPLLNT